MRIPRALFIAVCLLLASLVAFPATVTAQGTTFLGPSGKPVTVTLKIGATTQLSPSLATNPGRRLDATGHLGQEEGYPYPAPDTEKGTPVNYRVWIERIVLVIALIGLLAFFNKLRREGS